MKRFAFIVPLLLLSVPCLALEAPVFFGYEVVVTALKRPQPLKQSFLNVKVLDSREIERSGAVTVADALRLSPDVYIKTTGGPGGIASIKLRSAASEQVLVLVDGYRINSSLLGVTDLNDIPVINVERIEIVKEPDSSVYGADALGGVINIITKRKADGLVAASVNGGSYGLIDASLATGGRIGRLSYWLSYSQLGYDGFRQNGDYRNRNYSISIEDRDNASVNYSSSYSERGNPGVPPSDSDTYAASSPNDRQTDEKSELNVSLFNTMNGNSKNRLSFYQNAWTERVHYQDFFAGGFVDDEYLSRITGAELQNITSFANSAVLMTGAEWRRNYGQSSKAGIKTIDTGSLYVSGQVGADMPLAADAGIRYDSSANWGSAVTPRVGLIVNISPDTRIKTSVAKAFRAPTINELYWNDPSYGTYGNPNLKPEDSNCFNLTLENSTGGLDLSANYYLNRISNMISWQQTGMFSWMPQNTASARIEGLGLEVKKELIKGLSAYLGMNSESAVDAGTGKTLTYSPGQKINAGARLDAGRFSLDLKLRNVSSVFTDSANTKTVPAYRVVDLIFMTAVNEAKITVKALNVLNENYFESTGFSPVDWKERGYPMPGRTVEVGVKI